MDGCDIKLVCINDDDTVNVFRDIKLTKPNLWTKKNNNKCF